MRNIEADPVAKVVRYAHRMIQEYSLRDTEAALYAAAFSLYGDKGFPVGAEASYFSSMCGGRRMDTLAEVLLRRTQAGVIGTMLLIS